MWRDVADVDDLHVQWVVVVACTDVSEWAMGELGFWRWRAVRIDGPPVGAAQPVQHCIRPKTCPHLAAMMTRRRA